MQPLCLQPDAIKPAQIAKAAESRVRFASRVICPPIEGGSSDVSSVDITALWRKIGTAYPHLQAGTMARRRGGTWFALSITVCSTVTGLGCRQANEQCIDVLGKVAVMEKPWPDWVDVIGVPNSVIDSIGPGH